MEDVAKELCIGGYAIFGAIQQAHKPRQKLVKEFSSKLVSFQLLVELTHIVNDCQMEKNRIVSVTVLTLSKGEGVFVELDCLLKKYGVAIIFACQVMSKGEVEENSGSKHY
jgi:hypothetical protein